MLISVEYYRRLSEKFVYAQHKVRKFDTRVVLPMSEEPWTGCRAHVSRIRDQKDDHHRKHSARDDAPRGVEYLSECLIDFTIAEFPFLYYRYYSTDDNAQGFFSVGQGGENSPPEIFDKKRVFNFLTRKKARFLGKIPADFRFSPPGKIRFLPFPPWKKPEKKNPDMHSYYSTATALFQTCRVCVFQCILLFNCNGITFCFTLYIQLHYFNPSGRNFEREGRVPQLSPITHKFRPRLTTTATYHKRLMRSKLLFSCTPCIKPSHTISSCEPQRDARVGIH